MSLALHLRALGRRNGSSTLAPCHDLSFSQQCWSLPQTRFLVRLPRQVFLEIIILDERGEEGSGEVGWEESKEGEEAQLQRWAEAEPRLWMSLLLPVPGRSGKEAGTRGQ